MKQSKFQFEYRSNASRGHKKVGEILRNSPYFENYQSYQEWPVEKINPQWTSGRHHFDWVVPSLKLVIEFHGAQHFKAACFGGISQQEAEDKFKQQQIVDLAKEQAAVSAGWSYIAIPYDIEFDDEWILAQYRNFSNPNKPITKAKLSDWATKYKLAKESYNSSQYAVDNKERASQYRKKQYQIMKDIKKNREEK